MPEWVPWLGLSAVQFLQPLYHCMLRSEDGRAGPSKNLQFYCGSEEKATCLSKPEKTSSERQKNLKDSLISTILWMSYPKFAWSGSAPQELMILHPALKPTFSVALGESLNSSLLIELQRGDNDSCLPRGRLWQDKLAVGF